MKKVLVTGHQGFIGSHLFKYLKEHNFDVLGMDIKSGNDIRDITASRLKGIDTILHLAALPRIPFSIEFPLVSHDNNANATLKLLVKASQAKVRRFVYSASSSAYGNQDTLPLHEEMKPNPMSPYAVQKLLGEYYCKVFADIYSVQTVSLRYFNVYGEGMSADDPYSPAIARFLDFKAKNEPLTVYGGQQTRDFTYVGDVVKANIMAMNALNIGNGEVINIGSGKSHSIDEIAKTISSNIIYSEQRKGEPMSTLANITKAKELLGWEPSVNLLSWLQNLKTS